jgi:hypothetical protein
VLPSHEGFNDFLTRELATWATIAIALNSLGFVGWWADRPEGSAPGPANSTRFPPLLVLADRVASFATTA